MAEASKLTLGELLEINIRKVNQVRRVEILYHVGEVYTIGKRLIKGAERKGWTVSSRTEEIVDGIEKWASEYGIEIEDKTVSGIISYKFRFKNDAHIQAQTPSASGASSPAKRRERALQRDAKIFDRYDELTKVDKISPGKAIDILSDEFHLSPLTIKKKIIYSTKRLTEVKQYLEKGNPKLQKG
ncbi:MAG: hypothetical protein V3U24_03660 [Candidatus Neomarinimicrobiota bacterium]